MGCVVRGWAARAACAARTAAAAVRGAAGRPSMGVGVGVPGGARPLAPVNSPMRSEPVASSGGTACSGTSSVIAGPGGGGAAAVTP